MKLNTVKIWSFVLLGAILSVMSCRRDKEVINETIIFGDEPAIYVNTSISGVVSDETGNPINFANVSIDGYSVSSDDNGFFYLKDVSANKNGTAVKVEKQGYFTISKLIYPDLNRVEFVKIVLIDSKETGKINGETGGKLSFQSSNPSPFGENASITFPENAFEHRGAIYKGEVSVHASFLDPTSSSLFETMPGSLIGVNNEGVVVGMQTFGMIGVEMYTDSGEKLELAPGVLAEISFPLPAELSAVAEETINLWHFDQKSAYWVQEGEARLEESNYVAKVSHFSFWNCDAPFDLVNVNGRIVTKSGFPVSNTKIEITNKDVPSLGTGTGYTSKYGFFSGKIPANNDLILNIYDNCGDLAHTQNIGPFSSFADLGDIEIELAGEMKVFGQLINCNQEAVSNGYALIEVGESIGYAPCDDDGYFSITMGFCLQNMVTIVGTDLDNFEKSDEIIYGFSENLDAGTIHACGNIVYLFTLTIDGVTGVAENCRSEKRDSIPPDEKISVWAEGASGDLYMQVDGAEIGTFDVTKLDVGLDVFSNLILDNPQMTCTISQLDPAPSTAKATFEGTIYDTVSKKTLDVSGSFIAEFK